MLKAVNRESLHLIKNELLRKDIERYVEIYESFMTEFISTGLQIAVDNTEKAEALKQELTKLGVKSRNGGKSYLWGEISPSCEHCITGEGSSTFILSLQCNRDCFFCTNKNQYNYSYAKNNVNNIIDEFDKTVRNYGKMRSVAITGGEPLIFADKCVKFIRHAKKDNKKTETRIYTNGDLVTEEVLEKLKKAGLNEIRFGLKPENGVVSEDLYEKLSLAVKYIPRTMVEMPCGIGQLDSMKTMLDRLETIGIYGINVLEFLFPWVHAKEYAERGYKVKNRPYKVLYDYTYAGGVPVAGSEEECLELIKYAALKKFKTGVHYCSLENKLTSQIWHHNRKLKTTDIEFFSSNDFFVKTAKAFGVDAEKAKELLDKAAVSHYTYNASDSFIEFSVHDIKHLKDANIELGISYMILDYDEQGSFVRELSVAYTDSESFDINDI